MKERLFATDRSATRFLLRVVIASVMFPHGAQKLFGWFGGYGFTGTMGFFEAMGLPATIGLLVILIESFGAIALALGLATRVAATGMIAVMVGAIATVHLPNGLFMNWFGNQAGEGFEFHLLVIAISSALMLDGAGRFSIDRLIARHLAARIPASVDGLARASKISGAGHLLG
jgi:putative oxidoreductase